jgi:membrane protein implicated in regulation of membrane protease activity
MSTKKPGLLRRLSNALFGADRGYELADEDLDAFGAIVRVAATVRPDDASGRIEFRGSTWSASSVSGTLPTGSTARIVYRDNLTWIIEAADDSSADREQ